MLLQQPLEKQTGFITSQQSKPSDVKFNSDGTVIFILGTGTAGKRQLLEMGFTDGL